MIWIPVVSIIVFVIAVIGIIPLGIKIGWRASLFIAIVFFIFSAIFLFAGYFLYSDFVWPWWSHFYIEKEITTKSVDIDTFKYIESIRKTGVLVWTGLLSPVSIGLTALVYYFVRRPLSKYLGHKTRQNPNENNERDIIVRKKPLASKITGGVILGTTTIFAAAFITSAVNVITVPMKKRSTFNKLIDKVGYIYGLGYANNNEEAQIIHDFFSDIDGAMVASVKEMVNIGAKGKGKPVLDESRLNYLVKNAKTFEKIYKNTDATNEVFNAFLRNISTGEINPLMFDQHIVTSGIDSKNNEIGYGGSPLTTLADLKAYLKAGYVGTQFIDDTKLPHSVRNNLNNWMINNLPTWETLINNPFKNNYENATTLLHETEAELNVRTTKRNSDIQESKATNDERNKIINKQIASSGWALVPGPANKIKILITNYDITNSNNRDNSFTVNKGNKISTDIESAVFINNPDSLVRGSLNILYRDFIAKRTTYLSDEATFNKANDEYVAQKKKYYDALNKLDQAKDELRVATENYNNANANYNQILQQLNSIIQEITNLTNKINSLKNTQIPGAEKNEKDLKQALKAAQDDEISKKQINDQAKKSRDDYNTNILQPALNAYNQAQSTLDNEKDELSRLKNNLSQYQSKKSSEQNNLESAKRDKNTAQSNIDSTNSSITTKTVERNNKQSELTQVENELANNPTNQELKNRKNSLETSISSLNSEITSLQTDLRGYDTDKSKAEAAISAATSKISSIDAGIHSTESSISTANTNITKYSIALNNAKTARDDAQDQYKIKNNAYESANNAYTKAIMRRRELETQHSNAVTRLNDLKTELAISEASKVSKTSAKNDLETKKIISKNALDNAIKTQVEKSSAKKVAQDEYNPINAEHIRLKGVLEDKKRIYEKSENIYQNSKENVLSKIDEFNNNQDTINGLNSTMHSIESDYVTLTQPKYKNEYQKYAADANTKYTEFFKDDGSIFSQEQRIVFLNNKLEQLDEINQDYKVRLANIRGEIISAYAEWLKI